MNEGANRAVEVLRRNAVTVVSLLVAIAALLWGSGVLRQPKLYLSSGAIYLRIPAKFMLELSNVRLMTRAPELERAFDESVTATLREYGMAEDKIVTILKEKGAASLPPHEERAVNAAIAKAMASVGIDTVSGSMQVPSAVLFFEIQNNGSIAAKEVHVVIRLRGKPIDLALETDNKILQKEVVGPEYRLDFAAIAPGSVTKGIIWYSGGDPQNTEKENVIAVSYENGTIRQAVPADTFFVRP